MIKVLFFTQKTQILNPKYTPTMLLPKPIHFNLSIKNATRQTCHYEQTIAYVVVVGYQLCYVWKKVTKPQNPISSFYTRKHIDDIIFRKRCCWQRHFFPLYLKNVLFITFFRKWAISLHFFTLKQCKTIYYVLLRVENGFLNVGIEVENTFLLFKHNHQILLTYLRIIVAFHLNLLLFNRTEKEKTN